MDSKDNLNTEKCKHENEAHEKIVKNNFLQCFTIGMYYTQGEHHLDYT